MKEITPEKFLDALANAAYQVSVEKLFLTDDFDYPITPESLVQVVIAQNLNKKLHINSIKLEISVDSLLKGLSGKYDEKEEIRNGRIDIVCWENPLIPLAIIEVKDELNGTDDGLLKDVKRIKQLLLLKNKMFNQSIRFGGIVAYIGKNNRRYKKNKYLDQQLEPYVNQTIETIKRKIIHKIDNEKFEVMFKVGRCVDSAKNINEDFEDEESRYENSLSGKEQMTKYLVAIFYLKNYK